MKTTFGLHLLKNILFDIYNVWVMHQPPRHPLLLTFFVTFRCNLNCSYCGYKKNKFHTMYEEMDTNAAKRILEICRPGISAVAFSGGEPLIREDIFDIVNYARQLKYKPISLFTNSILLDQNEMILDCIDFLQISMDTTNEKTQNKLSGKEHVGKTIKANIERYARLQEKKQFRININCVLGPDNVEDLPDLLGFVEKNNVRLTVCPQLDQLGHPADYFKQKDFRKKYIKVLTASN